MKDLIQKKLEQYNVNSSEDELNALKEITQEVILYSLSQAGFFEKACFIGGTCLRIVHGLDRFSEDLDFSTLEPNQDFSLDIYLEKAMEIMRPYGYALTIDNKDLKDKNVRSRFIKDDSIKKILTFKHRQDERQKIKIKVEIDTCPPLGAVKKTEFLDFPEDFQILSYDLPSLLAGKIHALLCRNYIKGRDWYDFSWYIKNNHSPNLKLLENSFKQFGRWKGQKIQINEKFLKEALITKVRSLNWNEVKQDVRTFLPREKAKSLEMWSAEFFEAKIKKLKL